MRIEKKKKESTIIYEINLMPSAAGYVVLIQIGWTRTEG